MSVLLFAPDRRRTHGIGSYCRECQNAHNKRSFDKDVEKARKQSAQRTRKYYRSHRKTVLAREKHRSRVSGWVARLVSSSRQIAKKHNYDFDIDEAFVNDLVLRQDGRCYWLGVPLIPSERTRDPQRPSLERLDCAGGHTRDNVVLACQFANMGRSSAPAERMWDFVTMLVTIMRAA